MNTSIPLAPSRTRRRVAAGRTGTGSFMAPISEGKPPVGPDGDFLRRMELGAFERLNRRAKPASKTSARRPGLFRPAGLAGAAEDHSPAQGAEARPTGRA